MKTNINDNHFIKPTIKILLAVVLFGCLLKVPYGYFQFVRIACFVGFSFLAYKEYENKKPLLVLFYLIVGILFNPLIKVYFKRDTWNVIDVVVAIILLVLACIEGVVYLKKKITYEREAKRKALNS